MASKQLEKSYRRTVMIQKWGKDFRDITNIPRGEAHPRCKLTERQVRAIRFWYSLRMFNRTRIAKRFGVSPTTVYEIVNRETWKHVP